MRNMKKIITGGVLVLALTATSMLAYAETSYDTPAAAAAGVTGKTIEEVVELHLEGKTYGTIAAEAGKLEEFKAAMGTSDISCDGTGCGNGVGAGCGVSTGQGTRRGCGQGQGRGMNRRDGSCLYQ